MISYDICHYLTSLSVIISGTIHVAAEGVISSFFHGWALFHGVYIPHLPYPFICRFLGGKYLKMGNRWQVIQPTETGRKGPSRPRHPREPALLRWGTLTWAVSCESHGRQAAINTWNIQLALNPKAQHKKRMLLWAELCPIEIHVQEPWPSYLRIWLCWRWVLIPGWLISL